MSQVQALTVSSWFVDTCLDFHGSQNSLPLPSIVRLELKAVTSATSLSSFSVFK